MLVLGCDERERDMNVCMGGSYALPLGAGILIGAALGSSGKSERPPSCVRNSAFVSCPACRGEKRSESVVSNHTLPVDSGGVSRLGCIAFGCLLRFGLVQVCDDDIRRDRGAFIVDAVDTECGFSRLVLLRRLYIEPDDRDRCMNRLGAAVRAALPNRCVFCVV